MMKRLAFMSLIALGVSVLACAGPEEDPETDPNNEPAACPFTFPTPEVTYDAEQSPALLTFALPEDGELTVNGEDGTGVAYFVESLQAFTTLDGTRLGPSITYQQNLQGPSVLFTPDEVAAEYDRIANNSEQIFGATISNETLDLGGDEANVLVARAPDNTTMTVFVPIDEGAFIVPVTIGVFATVQGCEDTIEDTYVALKASIARNADTTYHDLAGIQEIKADKSN